MLSQEELISLQKKLSNNEMIIIKFTADWCVPCKSIKGLVDKYVNILPEKIQYYEIDIDESLELYMKFKKSKMVTGIPAILAFKAGKKDYWYIPDDSALGSNKETVNNFFIRCINYSK